MIKISTTPLTLFFSLCLLISACTIQVGGAPTKTDNIQQQAWAEIDNGALLIDVRSPEEYSEGHLDKAINIPHTEIGSRLSELNQDQAIVLYCRSGGRAGQAQKILHDNGYTKVLNAGGYSQLLAKR
ncbi:MAG: rhodanese-like domain-containing protein [Bdellovibrionota bacterium]